MHRKFKSIAFSDKYGYAFDTDAWEFRANPFLTQKFRMFETYGDGLCQHSTDWAVTEDFAIDYLYSLATVVREDQELGDRVEYTCNYTVSQDRLKFAASLIYDEKKDNTWGKYRYYSMAELKVTRNQDKQHDKRYERLTEYQTGKPESILRLLVPEYCDGYERWQLAEIVRNWSAENLKNAYMEMPAVHLKWFESAKAIRGRQADQYELAREFRDAHETLKAACGMWRNKRIVDSYVESYQARLERQRQQKAEAEPVAESTEAA